MKAISFFSFKGGVGRTQALLNTAYILARKKYFVVIMDMDIHAPGLSLMPEMAPAKATKTPGLIDFLVDVFDKDNEYIIDLEDIVYQPKFIKEINDPSFKGDIMFLPCGHLKTNEDARAYHRKLRELPLNSLNDLRTFGKNTAILDEIKNHLEDLTSKKLKAKTPDFLFIDSRTGFTEISDMVISQASDHVVSVFGLNEQNRRGLEIILSEILNDESYPINNLPGRLSIVLSPVPDGEESLKADSFNLINNALQKIARWDDSRNSKEAMPEIFTIPYHPVLALTENIISRDYPDSRPARAYEKIAEHLEKHTSGVREYEARVAVETKTRFGEVIPEEDKAEGRPKLLKSLPHPLTRTIPWNLLCPEKTAKDIMPELKEGVKIDFQSFLSLLASSLSLSLKEKINVIQSFNRLEPEQFRELLNIMQTERNQFFSIPREHWTNLINLFAEKFEEWLAVLYRLGLVETMENAYSLLAKRKIQKRIEPLNNYPQFWSARGSYLYGRYKYTEAEKAYSEAFRLHKEVDDKLGMANAQQGLADLYLRTARLEEAEKAYSEAFRLHKEVDAKLGMANDQRIYGGILAKKGDYKEAFNVLEAAEKEFERLKDTEGVAETLVAKARLFSYQRETETSRQLFDMALSLAENAGLLTLTREIEQELKKNGNYSA